MNLKPELHRCFKLLDNNFSLVSIGIGTEKIPNIKWKDLQTKPLTKEQFENFYYLQDTEKTKKTEAIGIITGYNGLEAIDIDLKVLNSLQEKEQFWNEYLSFLKDNIEDFEQKFVIVKTQNGGYHIIYRCKTITGNKKIATPEGTDRALIESRGTGGYIFIYSNFIQGTDYTDIVEISETDRDILWSISKTYHFVKEIETPEIKYKKVEKQHFEQQITVWDDYNAKTRLWDLISSEFTIVRKLSNKIVIKRDGATTPHSGYIFDNSDCLYLFSTGTKYPAEKLLNAFSIYTIQNHFGNYSEAAKDLYKQGFGTRFKKIETPKNEKIEIPETENFPLEVFPENLQQYIFEVHKTLNASIDYLGCSLLWVLSLCIGNAIKLEVKKGWIESGVIWLAIIGKAGIGKTHNIQTIIRPLQKLNIRKIKEFNVKYDQYLEYEKLSKKEKETAFYVEKPQKKQFIVGDITIESFFEHHEQNKNGIGIFRDELSGWIKDLNKYRPGSDLETYLSCWSNQSIILNRKTAGNAFVQNAFVPIIGGVQPSILSMHYTSENKDNGFIDRILLCYPELDVEKYNEKELSEELITWYDEYIISLFDVVRTDFLKYDNYDGINPTIVKFNETSKKEWIRIFNKITDLQNSENENEYMKSMLPKQKSYICRFALLLNVLYSYNDGTDLYTVSEKAIKSAEKLSDYFIKMAKKNKFETMENSEIIEKINIIKKSGKNTAKEQFESIYSSNPDINQLKIAEQLNVSRMTISRWIKEINKTNVTLINN